MRVDTMRHQMTRAAMLVDPGLQTTQPTLHSGGEISIVVVTPDTRRKHGPLLQQAFALRHRCFVDGRGWDELRRPDGFDRDVHDGGETLHVLDLNGTHVIGHLRLIPGGYLHAAKADPDRFSPPRRSEEIFGLSRLCYEPGFSIEQCWMGFARLFGAAAAVGRRQHVRQFIFDTDPLIVLYMRALGLRPIVIGETVQYRGRPMQPVALAI